jgi:tetratricopeptide (TPR) repeat protein
LGGVAVPGPRSTELFDAARAAVATPAALEDPGALARAAALYERGLARAPFAAEERLRLATLLEALGRDDAAAAAFLAAVASDPHRADVLLAVAEGRFLRRAVVDGSDADRAAAAALIRRAATLDSDKLPHALERSALFLYEGLGRPIDPAFFRAATPEAPGARVHLGDFFLRHGRPADALAELTPAARAPADGPAAHELRARAALALGRADEAREALADAIRASKDREDTAARAVRLLREAGQDAVAVPLFRQLAAGTADPLLHRLAGAACRDAGDLRAAVAHLQASLRRRETPEALELLYGILRGQRLDDAALEVLGRLVRLRPDRRDLLEERARLLRRRETRERPG